MRYFLPFILGLFVASVSIGQPSCDSSNLVADMKLLQQFWTSFKDAINKKDKARLAELCSFPFTCSFCIIDSSKDSGKPYVNVTRAEFGRSQYRIFFAEKLVEDVNRYNPSDAPYIISPAYNTVTKSCSYSFGYVWKEENARHPGGQIFFSIQKKAGKFKIFSAWTIP